MITTTRNQQIILQTYFFNAGCQITLYNKEKRLTPLAREALKDLVNKKVLSYKREGKTEILVSLQGRKEVIHGERLTQNDTLEMVSADMAFSPLFIIC